MKRHLAPLTEFLVIAVAGCASSTPSTAPGSPEPAASSQTTAPPPSPSPTAPSPKVTPSPAPVAGGTATDFCGAFKEIQAVSAGPTGDMASVGAHFQAAASDMRTYAPSEISAAANTYADVMGNIGKAASSGTMDEAAMSKAIADGMGEKAKDIGTVAIWVAKNCHL